MDTKPVGTKEIVVLKELFVLQNQEGTNSILETPTHRKYAKILVQLHKDIISDTELSDQKKTERLNGLLEKTFSLLDDLCKTEERVYQKGSAISEIGKEILSSNQEINKEFIQSKLAPALKELHEEIEPVGLKSQSLEKKTEFHLLKTPDCSKLIESVALLQKQIEEKEKEAIEKEDNSALISLALSQKEQLEEIKKEIENMRPLISGWLENSIKLINKNEERLFNPEHISSVSKQTTISEENLQNELKVREKHIAELKSSYDKVSHEWFQINETRDQIAFLLQKCEFRGKAFCAIAQGEKKINEISSQINESINLLQNATQENFGKISGEQEKNEEKFIKNLELAENSKSESHQKNKEFFTKLEILQKEIKKDTAIRFENLHLYNQELSSEIAKKSLELQEKSDKDFQILTELYHSKVDEAGKNEGSCLIKKQELRFELVKTLTLDTFLNYFKNFYEEVEKFNSSVKNKEKQFLLKDLEVQHQKFMEKSDELRKNSVRMLEELFQAQESLYSKLPESFKKIASFGTGVSSFLLEEKNSNYKCISEKSNKAISFIENEWNNKLKQGVDILSTTCVQYLVDANQENFNNSVIDYKKSFEFDKNLERKNQTLTGAIEKFKKLYRETMGKTQESEVTEFNLLIEDYNKNCLEREKLNKKSFENMKKDLLEKTHNLEVWVEKLKTYENHTNKSNIEIFSKSAKEQNQQLEHLAREHKNLWTCMDTLFADNNQQQSFAYELCRLKYAMNRETRTLPTDYMFNAKMFGWTFEERDLVVQAPSEKEKVEKK